jgi:hypothetical protein
VELVDDETTARFLACVPRIKQNIAALDKRSLEVEYEQMLIRANNYERRNASEYFIVDRQYAIAVCRSSEGLFRRLCDVAAERQAAG